MAVRKKSVGRLESYEEAGQFDYGTFLASTFEPIPHNHQNWTVFQEATSLRLLKFLLVENLVISLFSPQNLPQLSIEMHLEAPIYNYNKIET